MSVFMRLYIHSPWSLDIADHTNMWAMLWNTGVKYRVVRRPLTYYYCPALILLPYLTTICSVHLEIDTFAHNDHDGYVQFSTNLTQKRFWYRSRRLIFINIRPLLVHPPYYLSYDCSYIPMYEIYSWKRFINDRKIAVIILCIGSTFGNIYSKYVIVYCGYHFSFDYVCSSAIVYMCDVGVKTSIKMVRYLYKMIIITQTGNALLCGRI